MRKHVSTRALTLLAVGVSAFTSLPVLAQTPGNGPSVPQVSNPTAKPGPRGKAPADVPKFAKALGLTSQQYAEQVALDDDVAQAAAKITEAFGDSFVASVIDRTPTYRVTLVFTKDVSPAEVNNLVSSKLRPSIKIKRSALSKQQIEERQATLSAALVAADVPNSVSFDFRNDKFVVTGDRKVSELQALIPPALRSDVIVRSGAPSLLQTGVQPGDTVYGAWAAAKSDGTAACSFSFPSVTTSDNKAAILTANHCPGPVMYIKYSSDNHLVSLGNPIVDDGGTSNGRTYDYRVYSIPSLPTGPYVWGWNNRSETYRYFVGPGNDYETRTWANVNPDLLIDGEYLNVTGLQTGGSAGGNNPAHPIGAFRCKSGWRTGTTCGQITASSVTVSLRLSSGVLKTYYGVVEFTTPSYMVSSYGGDSGGAVFTALSYNSTTDKYEIKAAGTLIGGETRSLPDGGTRPCISPDDGSCPTYYMPIDRINDRIGVAVMTLNGNLSP